MVMGAEASSQWNRLEIGVADLAICESQVDLQIRISIDVMMYGNVLRMSSSASALGPDRIWLFVQSKRA